MRHLARLWIIALLVTALPALAQDAGPDSSVVPGATASSPGEEAVSARSLALFTKLMSPYCPGATLRDCGSGQATVLRDRIRTWIREGQSDEQIVASLVDEFGETILGAPRFKGFGMVAYIAPIAALLIGLGVLIAYLRRQRGVATKTVVEGPAHPTHAANDPALRRRLEDELRHHAGG